MQTRAVQCLAGGRPALGCFVHQKPTASLACNTHFCPIAEKKGECLEPLGLALASRGGAVPCLERFLSGPEEVGCPWLESPGVGVLLSFREGTTEVR